MITFILCDAGTCCFLDNALDAKIGEMSFRFCNSSYQQLPVNLS